MIYELGNSGVCEFPFVTPLVLPRPGRVENEINILQTLKSKIWDQKSHKVAYDSKKPNKEDDLIKRDLKSISDLLLYNNLLGLVMQCCQAVRGLPA